MTQTDETLETHADRCATLLHDALPEDVGYVLMVVRVQDGTVIWNTNLDPQAVAADAFRVLADDIDENGCPPRRPLEI